MSYISRTTLYILTHAKSIHYDTSGSKVNMSYISRTTLYILTHAKSIHYDTSGSKVNLGYISRTILLILTQTKSIHYDTSGSKGWELNSAATLASQPAAGHRLSFIITIVIMTLGWGLFVGLAAESCGRIWLPCLRWIWATFLEPLLHLGWHLGSSWCKIRL